jgi:uncharacterized protein (DUF1330 family)
MSKGYLVGHIKVHDKEGFEKFKAMAGPVIGEYGGIVLARDPNPEAREGDVEYPSGADRRRVMEPAVGIEPTTC